jgi:hypothetical protein
MEWENKDRIFSLRLVTTNDATELSFGVPIGLSIPLAQHTHKTNWGSPAQQVLNLQAQRWFLSS